MEENEIVIYKLNDEDIVAWLSELEESKKEYILDKYSIEKLCEMFRHKFEFDWMEHMNYFFDARLDWSDYNEEK
ncbi:MAG: hypothetical protein ACRC2K_13440 [Clostridium sp.]